MLKIGSHVGMSGKEMFLNSVKEAVSYGANTFMIYTGAPQNTRRKSINELNIEAGQAYMKEHGIDDFVVHAPYIINLGNSIKQETYELAVNFLQIEIERTAALGSKTLVLHPGSHVNAGEETGLKQIISGLNLVLTADTPVNIALETMAGKGSEIGRSFEQLAAIYDGVHYNDKLRVCFDTCHTNDNGYDVVNNFEGVIEEFDRILGKEQIAVFHINDSKNGKESHKDRHENIGFGHIGFDALYKVIMYPDFMHVPKILETPYIPDPDDKSKSYPPYKEEIEMIRSGVFNPELKELIIANHR
ncbi:deoxyribonuclease IV [Anaeromicropila populeti]|uniref:Probable endonuclease 4 n=1 Tax=Anaeromicropila populeti TaxID=37658 RepID=A0A1I6LM16_9FIRM|nr:deoxyribonuclease IV [Anaeromicropila populeti]SFS04516.1 Endonuclease IV [Anaeromicropila populeti]